MDNILAKAIVKPAEAAVVKDAENWSATNGFFWQ